MDINHIIDHDTTLMSKQYGGDQLVQLEQNTHNQNPVTTRPPTYAAMEDISSKKLKCLYQDCMVLLHTREAVCHEHATYVMQASQNVPGTSLSASVAGHCSSIVGTLRGNAMKCAGNIYFNRTLA